MTRPGLGRVVKLEKPDGFVGAGALAERAKAKPRKVLAGLTLATRRVPLHGYAVLADGHPCGTVTSGAPSPTLGTPIAMTYLEPDVTHDPKPLLAVDIRGRADLGHLTRSLPFIGDLEHEHLLEPRDTAKHEWVSVDGPTAMGSGSPPSPRGRWGTWFNVPLPAEGASVTAEIGAVRGGRVDQIRQRPVLARLRRGHRRQRRSGGRPWSRQRRTVRGGLDVQGPAGRRFRR